MKKCKGTGKAKGFGCGEKLPYSERNGLKSYKSKYGLGLDCSCYTNWLISDNPKAKETFNSMLIKNKKDFEKKKKQTWNKKKLAIKKSLETKSDLEKKLQKEINLIVRLIDKGHECISSGRSLGKKYDAGHLYTTGAHPTIRFNLFNIFSQSVHDNQHKSGNELEYFFRLGELFSSDFQDFVVSLKQIDALHLSKDDIRDKISVARSLVKWLKLQDRTFSKEERLSVRSDMNNQLGIYPQKYCEFKL
jgi:hypothetical protein